MTAAMLYRVYDPHWEFYVVACEPCAHACLRPVYSVEIAGRAVSGCEFCALAERLAQLAHPPVLRQLELPTPERRSP